MARPRKSVQDPTFLQAALEGLELQKQRIEDQIRQVRQMLGGRSKASTAAAAPAEKPARKKRVLSEAARKRIAAAQKRRWANFRKEQEASA